MPEKRTICTKQFKYNLPLLTSENITWDGSGWIKGNVGQKGFYRVNYDDKNWEALANAFKVDHKVTRPENYIHFNCSNT